MRRAPAMASRAGASAELHPDSAPSHRASLFGGAFGHGSGSASQSRGGSASSSMQQALEEDNNRLTDDLSQKVSALRYASQSIHDEVSEQNRLLGGMGLDFDKTGGLMGGALQRLDGLLKAGRQGHMCYLIGFVLTVFLLLWCVQ